jgi:hypothetical protein
VPDSLASGNAIITDTVITNSTGLVVYADFSISFGSIMMVAPNYLGIFIYRSIRTVRHTATAASAAPPPGHRRRATGGATSSAMAGTAAPVGSISGVLKPGSIS